MVFIKWALKFFEGKKSNLKKLTGINYFELDFETLQEYSQIIILTIEATKKIDFLKLTDEETPLKK